MIKWPDRAQSSDLTGRPDEPWWTREAITWMEEHLTANMDAVEWGAGASTAWLAIRCRSLLSIEHNPEFAKMAAADLKESHRDPGLYTVMLRPLGISYYQCFTGSFDVAVIDGRMRVLCCERAAQALKPGGILLLDNAERKEYAKARSILSAWPVIETNNGFWQTNIWIKPNA